MTNLSNESIQLVQAGWQALFYDPQSTVVKQHFQKFFELEPAARSLFQQDLAQQEKLLGEMIIELISLLDSPELAKKLLVNTGKSHAAKGIQKKHYRPFLAALLFAIENQLKGQQNAAAVLAAWQECLSWAVDIMLEAYD